ncbi:hypothetical protein [Sphingomonas sp. Leaf343]|uniref:hypothetical protein n=1 Tax=Sphingomonas sp. Leaf343 TaxID=1736345 RepID=UPI0012E1600F|nr:hypothetical protein [Sphingomonas sp. Leaf343]
MKTARRIASHLSAGGVGAAIAGPIALAYGHTVEGIDAGDWLSIPNTVLGAVLGGAAAYLAAPKASTRGGRDEVNSALRDLRIAAQQAAAIDAEQTPVTSLEDQAIANAVRLFKAAERYDFARAHTPPEDAASSSFKVDVITHEIKGALEAADKALLGALPRHGAEFIVGHINEVKARFGQKLIDAVDVALA